MPPPMTLADLDISPERKIIERVVAILRAEAQLADVFNPIRALENASREAFLSYGVFTMTVQAFAVKAEDHPSKRSTSKLSVLVSVFLPNEQGEEDSAFVGLDLGSFLRSKLWGLAVTSGGATYTFATTEFAHLTPLIGRNGATRILSYRANFETDIDPIEGDFTA